ncbi:MAG: glycosyltransferase family 2 protein [Nocardioides sp.]|uniref:glycosyltransferase n=1 Tax=Nocardioides sp. TaxID=35761 RepID=UPI0039E5C975
MDRSVALVLVAHDGARWLPTVLDGIAAQRRAPDQLIGVDTGSLDGSADLIRDAFGSVLALSSSTSYPDALAHALAHAGDGVDGADGPEWLWLLHDDSTPDPGALETLMIAAHEFPEADLLGPKLREWPSLRRLLELGVTISGTGRRETGLERGEYDQGQHDEIRRVLAVNTAGLLVRRSALERLGGLDPQLPIFGNDIDLGWRAARAGLTTLIVPQAVVFHAEAAHRGLRRSALTGRHTHFQERRAALYTLLANSRARTLPLQLVRMLLGSLLRVAGLLATRQGGRAADEFAALVSVYVRPGVVHRARRARRELDAVPPAEVRALLAPWWLPYRHGLDVVGDLASAVTDQAADVAERRRIAAAEADPASFAARRQRSALDPDDPDDPYSEEGMLRDTGLVARVVTNPVALLLALAVLLLLAATRTAWGTAVGGGLTTPPGGVGSWWGLVLDSWHRIGQGTAVPASPYLLPLTLLATVLGGKPALAVSVVLIGAPLLALWGAWRLLRVLGRLLSIAGAPRWLILWGAVAWALVPLASGAWSDGRLGPVVASATLPWLAHAALGFADPEPERRWRAAWRAGLLLTLAVAFTPTAWLICALLAAVVVVVALVLLRLHPRRSIWGPPAVALAVPVCLLAAWWVPALRHGAGVSLLMDAGRPPSHAIAGWQLAVGRLGDLGAPWWMGSALPVLAVVALASGRARIPVLACWLIGVVAGLVALALSPVTLHVGATAAPVGTAFLLVLVQGAAIVAIVLGAQGALSSSPGVRGLLRIGVAVLLAAAALVPVAGGLAWAVTGDHGELGDSAASVVPAYMLEDAERGAAHGVLVLRGSVAEGVRYEVVRGDGITLGEDEILALSTPPAAFDACVRDFVSRPDAGTVSELAGSGIQYVVATSPVDPAVAAAIDATGGLSQASPESRAARAWQIDTPPSAARLAGPTGWLRWALVVLQLGGLVVVIVLAAPSVGRDRRRS